MTYINEIEDVEHRERLRREILNNADSRGNDESSTLRHLS
jgi:hypothetical protein